MTESTQARPRARDSGAAIAVAMGVMNVATYIFQMVTARVLGPQDFGAFAALMNVLLVVGVMSLAVQATAARRISASPAMSWASSRRCCGSPTAPPRCSVSC